MRHLANHLVTINNVAAADIELMTEKQVLSFKPAPRLEHVGDEHSERVQNRKHQSK